MATRDEGDPARDERADYDYGAGETAHPDLVADLSALVDGDVRFDSYSRQLYATDASIYEMTPIGVVLPRSTADVAAVMSYCAAEEIPVLPRGGGTSLAGQAVNEAVVLDFTRYLNDVRSVDPDGRTARAQVGVRLGDLDATLEPHGLKFAPDPAWGEKSALGGAIGNNSTGSHSLVYGKTDAYVEACEVVLADGTVTTLGEVTPTELRERADPDGDLEARIYAAVARILDEETDAVEAAYPDLKRNVSGYNLDVLVELADEAGWASGSTSNPTDGESGTINLAKLLAGSEGTLAIVTEATVSLEPIPETKALSMLAYDDLQTAMTDVATVLTFEPAAVEVLDDVLLELAAETEEFADLVAETVPEGTGSLLLVEFYAESDAEGRRKVDGLLADRVPDAVVEGDSEGAADVADSAVAPDDARTDDARTDEPVRAFAASEAHDEAARARFWQLRKSGLPILLSRTSDAKHISFIEDCAVPPERLPEYVADFQAVLEEQGTFASFYGHAGPGVLHIRPLVSTKTVEGVEQLHDIADAVTDAVVEYGGSVSGEHGDGRARTQWNRKLYGEHLWTVFRELKSAFDPDWLLNPGQVCGDVDMREHLRFDPDYAFDAGFDPTLNWENENGFEGMVELCHGCGGCRGPQETTGGVMCPTYRAAGEESTSTRGRANLLRQAMSGDLGPDAQFEVEFMAEIMDLCIGCKGCARDCPSGVDMAKLKTEIENEYHRRHGASVRDRLFCDIDRLAALGSAFAPASNWLPKLPGARVALERLVGIDRDRALPQFQRETFADWFESRDGGVPPAEATRRALLFADTYTNYVNPEVGRAAVRVLDAAGVHVRLVDAHDTGRPAHSKGFLDVAKERARYNVDVLAPRVSDGWDVVCCEPSDAVMLQHDYRDLLAGADVERVAANSYGVLEYLDRFELDPAFDAPALTVTYHGHCHQKATKKDGHAASVLRRAGYEVDHLDSGCCGMAGSFGYEAEHASMSRAIADVLAEQVNASDGDVVAAPGASCRAQLGERDGPKPPHPIELVAAALAEDRS